MEDISNKAEIVIENQIIKGVYSFHELMYRNKDRFQMILSQPDHNIHFDQVKAVFKGRFICKNDNCLQIKRGADRKKEKNDDSDNEYEDIHDGWMNWWKKQEKTIKPQVKEEGEIKSQAQYKVKLQQETKKQPKESSNLNNTKKKYYPKIKDQQTSKENTRWSSSLTYVIMHYRSYPESLDKLKKVYSRRTNNRIEIYFYIELMGQRCKTCFSKDFCYPFFGKTELKRMRRNFSSYIYNKIEGRPILRYKPCPLKRLKGHIKQLCQACELGQCGFRSQE